MALLPLIGLLFFSVRDYGSEINSKIATWICPSYPTGRTVNDIEQFSTSCKRKGLTAGYIGSSGSKFADKLPEQRVQTDEKLLLFEAMLEDFDTKDLVKP